MNASQLSKNVGQPIKIVPRALYRDPNTWRFREIDQGWKLEAVDPRKGGTITLFNTGSHHQVPIGHDSVGEYRSTGHLRLKVRIVLDGSDARLEPIWGS